MTIEAGGHVGRSGWLKGDGHGIWDDDEPPKRHPKRPRDWPKELVFQVPGDLAWQAEAMCLRVDLDFTEDHRIERIRKEAICRMCPVQDQCFDLGLEIVLDLRITDSQLPGTWAGLSGREISKLANERRKNEFPAHRGAGPGRRASVRRKRPGDQGPGGNGQDVDATADRRGAT